MRPITPLLSALAAALALTVAASAGAASAGAKVALRATSAGRILVNSKGFTLYAFSKDAKNKDACVAISQCTTFWPPLTTSGAPVAGAGVKASMLGTIRIKGGLRQVTYDGHPLYTFSHDDRPANTEYINVSGSGGRWPAVNGAGRLVK